MLVCSPLLIFTPCSYTQCRAKQLTKLARFKINDKFCPYSWCTFNHSPSKSPWNSIIVIFFFHSSILSMNTVNKSCNGFECWWNFQLSLICIFSLLLLTNIFFPCYECLLIVNSKSVAKIGQIAQLITVLNTVLWSYFRHHLPKLSLFSCSPDPTTNFKITNPNFH